MKKDLHTSAMNSSIEENIHHDQRENCNIKKSTFHSTSSKNIKSSNNSHYKPIFGKENRDKNQILLNISNVIPMNNNTECSFLTCIDNDTKSEIKSMMTVLKNEILEMYSSMVSEIRKDFAKKCEDIKNVENLVKMKIRKMDLIQKEIKEFDINVKKIAAQMEMLQNNFQPTELSITEEYRKQIEAIISQKTSPLLEDYNSLAKFAARLEDQLKIEFDMKISKTLNDIGQDNFTKILKENSSDYETSLKSTFEDLNNRIKGFEDKILNFQKRKEETFWNVRNDFERKFKEAENYFVTQMNVFKNLLATKLESKDFKNTMEDMIETKVLELKSDFLVNKNALSAQIEEMRVIKGESQAFLDNINFMVKESLNNITNNINKIEDQQNSDKNDLIEFEKKISELHGNVDKFKQNFQNLRKETEEKIIKNNENKLNEISHVKELLNKIKEKQRRTENIIENLKKDNQFSKINQLELLLNDFNNNFQKNQEESKILLETLKNKVNILSVENLRLKDREAILLKELDEMNKKQKIMFSLDPQILSETHENKSETAATNTNTYKETNKTKKHSENIHKNSLKAKKNNESYSNRDKYRNTEKNFEKQKPLDFNSILDQFEDYEEENSILSQETENDVFFYPNNNNNSLLSGSHQNLDFNENILPNFLSPHSSALRSPFDEANLELFNNNKNDECFVNNRKALINKESSCKNDKNNKFPDLQENFEIKLNSDINFYDQEKIEHIFANDHQQKKSKFYGEDFDNLMKLEYFFKKEKKRLCKENEPFLIQNDEAGYLKNENGKYIYDDMGNMIKITQEQANFLINKNIIKYS